MRCGFGFLGLPLDFGKAGFLRLALGFGLLGLPLSLGDTRFFSLALFLGDATRLRLACRLPLGFCLLLGRDAALLIEAPFFGDTRLVDLALQACRLGAALDFRLTLHLCFLLLGFLGELLRVFARGLALGLDQLLLARLIVLATCLRFLLRRTQHLRLVGSTPVGGSLLSGLRLLLGLGLRFGADFGGLGFLVALRFFAGPRELVGQRMRGVVVCGGEFGAIHPAHQRHGARRATTEATRCRSHNVLANQIRCGSRGAPNVAAKARLDFANKAGRA